MIDSLLMKLSFQNTISAPLNGDLRPFFHGEDRCGIYILHFADGDFYVGQAIDIAKRFRQHLARLDYFGSPILSISYKFVDRLRLDKSEKEAIGEFRMFLKTLSKEQRFRLKNIKDNEYQRGSSPFDSVMSPEEQDQWLQNLRDVDNHGPRYDASELREQYELRFYNVYCKKRFMRVVTQILRHYVRSTIPAIRQGEALFWASSCAPASNIYSRVNIGWQEVFTIIYDDLNDLPRFEFSLAYEHMSLATSLKQIIGFFEALTPFTTFEMWSEIDFEEEKNFDFWTGYVGRKAKRLTRGITFDLPSLPDVVQEVAEESKIALSAHGLSSSKLTEIQAELAPVFGGIKSLHLNSLRYEAGGTDQIRVGIYGINDPYMIIDNLEFRRGMREMNLRLMRQSTSKWKNNHCMSLADYLIDD